VQDEIGEMEDVFTKSVRKFAASVFISLTTPVAFQLWDSGVDEDGRTRNEIFVIRDPTRGFSLLAV
jgi:hypothetical protein